MDVMLLSWTRSQVAPCRNFNIVYYKATVSTSIDTVASALTISGTRR